MMCLFEADTADEVWRAAAARMDTSDDVQLHSGRGGTTRELMHTVFVIRDPRQRWIVNRDPGISPAFAIAEVIWILSGRNDAQFLNFWNPQLPKFSGTSSTYHGAYGYRLRHQFNFDQLERAFEALSNTPESRQLVLQIWDPRVDFPATQGQPRNSDIPCNVASMLKIRQGKLEWMQIMRSNDLYRGTPYNFVQFTSLHEVIAGWLGVEPGSYHHLSDSLHLYQDVGDRIIAASPVMVAHNTDSLRLSKQESDRSIALLAQYIDQLISPTLTCSELRRLVSRSEVAPGFHNFLLVLAAEAARRKSWHDVPGEFIASCSNPALTQTWHRWIERFDKQVSA